MSFRERLVKANASLKKTVQDLQETSHLVDNTLIIKLSKKQQNLIEQQIDHIEKEMEATLRQDEQVYKRFQLVKSVVGIGMVTAVAFLVYTQDFSAFDRTGAPERTAICLLRRSSSFQVVRHRGTAQVPVLEERQGLVH